ncbi:hypothetical protein ACFWJO_29800, partial [Streptomyces sp. NPDC127092]
MTAAPAKAAPTRAARTTTRAVHGAALLLTLTALGLTLWHGLDEPANALAFGVLIAFGELARWGARPGGGGEGEPPTDTAPTFDALSPTTAPEPTPPLLLPPS